MPSVCFYFQVHQPYRLRHYTFFDLGNNPFYEDENANCDLLLKIARKSYLPMNDLLFRLIREYGDKFKVSFSISGTALDQFEEYAPEVLDSFRTLAKTGCVEFLAETYSHSLAFLFSRQEFLDQVALHSRRIKELFGQTPTVFRNTELIYNNDLAAVAEEMGFKAVLAEGADHVLGWRSPNFLYQPPNSSKMKILLKNYALSDDIAFRFSNQGWSEYPLTADKYADWLHAVNTHGEVINLFMDYETFGEHQWESTGIFDFMRALPAAVLRHPDFRFQTPSEVAAEYAPKAKLDVHQFMSWADAERDLTAWLGNDMQHDAVEALYRAEEQVRTLNDAALWNSWRRLQTSDHFYYMCTKWFSDGDVHKYFNPYGSPYDAYINFMNILADFQIRLDNRTPRPVQAHVPAPPSEVRVDTLFSESPLQGMVPAASPAAPAKKAATATTRKTTAKKTETDAVKTEPKTTAKKNKLGQGRQKGQRSRKV